MQVMRVGKTETPPKLESINNYWEFTTAACIQRTIQGVWRNKKMQWGGAVVRIFGGIVGSQAIDPTLPNL